MTSSMGEKAMNGRRRERFSGAGSYGRFDFGPAPVDIEGDQDSNSIREVAVLKVNDSGKIRELYMGICEIPENRKKWNWKRNEKLKRCWGDLGKCKRRTVRAKSIN